MPLNTAALSDDPASIDLAAQMLRDGGLVALPTETVYGLGADAGNDRAVARVFDAKGRPSFNPLIIHLSDLEAARAFAHVDDRATKLAEAFWPGPLTMVLPLRDDAALSPLVTAGLPSVAIRVPAHPVARALLAAFGGPVAAPSANPSGRISPTRAAHVRDGLDGRIDAIIDGGACAVGVESTIIGLTQPQPQLLRPGGVGIERLEAALGTPLIAAGDDKITAPGQMTSHYAPRALMRLNADQPREGERLLGFGNVDGAAVNLSASGDLVEAAAQLFHALRALDAQGDAPIAVSPIPMVGLGRAINDRLARAAAPRAPSPDQP